jgi:hypothetical protein
MKKKVNIEGKIAIRSDSIFFSMMFQLDKLF